MGGAELGLSLSTNRTPDIVVTSCLPSPSLSPALPNPAHINAHVAPKFTHFSILTAIIWDPPTLSLASKLDFLSSLGYLFDLCHIHT